MIRLEDWKQYEILNIGLCIFLSFLAIVSEASVRHHLFFLTRRHGLSLASRQLDRFDTGEKNISELKLV